MENKNMMYKAAQPLNLDGTKNTRDIGGYITATGKTTKLNQFLRSDGLNSLSQSDVDFLVSYGLKCVIDLRSESEKNRDKESPLLLEKVDYYSIPMLDKAASANFAGSLPDSMGKVYVELLSGNGKEFAQIMRIISKYPEDTVLFHCSAGKDRTGVTAMLLLLLAEVPREQIIADYSTSEKNMREKFAMQKKWLEKMYGTKVPDYVFSSEPKEIELALKYIEENFVSAHDYLSKNGLEELVVEQIKSKLVS